MFFNTFRSSNSECTFQRTRSHTIVSLLRHNCTFSVFYTDSCLYMQEHSILLLLICCCPYTVSRLSVRFMFDLLWSVVCFSFRMLIPYTVLITYPSDFFSLIPLFVPSLHMDSQKCFGTIVSIILFSSYCRLSQYVNQRNRIDLLISWSLLNGSAPILYDCTIIFSFCSFSLLSNKPKLNTMPAECACVSTFLHLSHQMNLNITCQSSRFLFRLLCEFRHSFLP